MLSEQSKAGEGHGPLHLWAPVYLQTFFFFVLVLVLGIKPTALYMPDKHSSSAWTNIPPSLQWVSEFLIGFFFYFSNNLFVCILLLNVQENFNAKSYLCLTKAHISHNIFVLIRCKINFTSCLIWNVMNDIYAIRGMSSISVIFFLGLDFLETDMVMPGIAVLGK